ncbi:AAA family ATPase [Phosphitispora fastidiosa]|uniref:AAA family ATPase n=1 Tax=Phosphitispora fastidiosa TaxID=2837202 RepID=UPI001E473B44|nr:AAA family ATPase [Phosphitispora fastidiosa]MBU7007510.1 AAA15 family ATPase/GTPase [Phosphitispora fastidiosa]
MLINKLRVDGFRNINNTTIEFGDIVSLVGLNNYGKSNFIDSLDFAQKFIKYPSVSKRKLMKSEKNLPINIKMASRDFIFEIEYSTRFGGHEIFVIYEFSFEWIKAENKGCRIKSETLKLKEEGNVKYYKYITRKWSEGFYKSSTTGRTNTKINIDDDELIINKLQKHDTLYYLAIINELNQIKFDLNNYSDTSLAFEFFPFEMNRESVYDLNKQFGQNINKVIFHLKQNYPDKYELLINSFISLVPNIEMIEPVSSELTSESEEKAVLRLENDSDDLPFKIVDTVYSIRVKESQNNQTTNIEYLSNGSRRIFLLLTSAIVADIKNISLIAFEELENCVHPYLFQGLIITLSEIITDCRILVTSHSPYLIQYLDLKNIYLGIPYSDGIGQFKKVKKSAHRVILRNAREEGISVGDYIFNILIESKLDNSLLLSYVGG